MFVMQEVTRLATNPQETLAESKAPGLPTVAEVLDELQANDVLDEVIVCEPCARARNITDDEIADGAEFGQAPDLARRAEEHKTTCSGDDVAWTICF